MRVALEQAYLQYSRFSTARSGWDRPFWFWAATDSLLMRHWCCCRCTPANRASSPCRLRWSSGWRQRKPRSWPAAFEPRGHTKPWRFILVHTLTGPTCAQRSASGRGSFGHTFRFSCVHYLLLCLKRNYSPDKEREKEQEYYLKRSLDAQNILVAAVKVRWHQLCPLRRLHTGFKRAWKHDCNIVYKFRTLQTSSPLQYSVYPLYLRLKKTLCSVPTLTTPLLKAIAKEDTSMAPKWDPTLAKSNQWRCCWTKKENIWDIKMYNWITN